MNPIKAIAKAVAWYFRTSIGAARQAARDEEMIAEVFGDVSPSFYGGLSLFNRGWCQLHMASKPCRWCYPGPMLTFDEDSLRTFERHPDYPETIKKISGRWKNAVDDFVLSELYKPGIARLYRLHGCGKHLTTTLPCHTCRIQGSL